MAVTIFGHQQGVKRQFQKESKRDREREIKKKQKKYGNSEKLRNKTWLTK